MVAILNENDDLLKELESKKNRRRAYHERFYNAQKKTG